MAALPVEKAPLKDTPGEKYRQYQYAIQLPAHDMDINHCNKLSAMEQEEFAVFLRLRREKALGRGLLREITENGQHVRVFNCMGLLAHTLLCVHTCLLESMDDICNDVTIYKTGALV